MSHITKVLFLAFLISISAPYHAFALGDVISEAASSVGGFAKGVGKTVGIGNTTNELDHDASLALNALVKESPAAAELAKTAKAILIFPKIVKAGLVIGGHHGKGVLRQHGITAGYYNTVAGSYGLQIGAQTFGYVMFFMDDASLSYLLSNNAGWEVGVGPSLVVVDEGMATSMNNTTLTKSVYVFSFSQKGLMAGLGIQGSKITRVNP